MTNSDASRLTGAPSLDSEPWHCQGCGGHMIGKRPANDVCRSCTGLRMTVADPAAITSRGIATEPVKARDVRKGDVLLYQELRLTVLEHPHAARYHQDGAQVVDGLSIPCRAGTALWCLYRRPSEILHRERAS